MIVAKYLILQFLKLVSVGVEQGEASCGCSALLWARYRITYYSTTITYMKLELFWRSPHVIHYLSTITTNESKYSSKWHKWDAVATRERSAAFVSFQRLAAGLPPTQNVTSAPRSLTSTCHFSGNTAQIATNAVTSAYSLFLIQQ